MKKELKKTKVYLSLLPLLFVSSCSSYNIDKTVKKENNFVEQKIKNFNNQKKNSIYSKKDNSSLSIMDYPYVYSKSIHRSSILPYEIANKEIIFKNPKKTSVDVIVKRMSKSVGFDIYIERDVLYKNNIKQKSYAKANENRGGGLDSSSLPSSKSDKKDNPYSKEILKILNQDKREENSNKNKKEHSLSLKQKKDKKNKNLNKIEEMSFVFEGGTFEEMLNNFTQDINAYWRYDELNNRVVIYKYITKNFTFAVGSGSTKSSSKLSDDSMGSSFSSEFVPWDEISKNIEMQLTSEGKFSISEATSTITIRDEPETLNKIETYLKSMNSMFSNQVDIEVKIFSIIRNIDDNRGINWDVVFSGSNILGTVVTPSGTAAETVSSVLKIPPTATGALQNFIGSQIFINNLSTYGKLSSQVSLSFSTINNQPVPIKNVSNISYLKKQEVTMSNGTPTKSLEPSEFEVGTSFYVLPSIQKNKKDMLLQISGTIKDMVEMKTFDGGNGNVVQLPTISKKQFMNRVWVKSGETIILSGMEFIKNNNVKKGFLSADFWAFGGSKQQYNKKESIIIIITPKIKKINLESNTSY